MIGYLESWAKKRGEDILKFVIGLAIAREHIYENHKATPGSLHKGCHDSTLSLSFLYSNSLVGIDFLILDSYILSWEILNQK